MRAELSREDHGHARTRYEPRALGKELPRQAGTNTSTEFGAQPRETMIVGDSEVDVQTARNAGTIAAAVNYGFGVHDRTQHPADIYLDKLSDLVPLLD